jgi:hypothetical protein
MTAPFLSLAQIRNRLILSARWILRDHSPARDGRCLVCRVADCRVRSDAAAYLAWLDSLRAPR